MGTSFYLKNHAVVDRMTHHPVATVMGGLISAFICGILGFAHGGTIAVIMAGLGAVIGAPLGAMLAASNQREP